MSCEQQSCSCTGCAPSECSDCGTSINDPAHAALAWGAATSRCAGPQDAFWGRAMAVELWSRAPIDLAESPPAVTDAVSHVLGPPRPPQWPDVTSDATRVLRMQDALATRRQDFRQAASHQGPVQEKAEWSSHESDQLHERVGSHAGAAGGAACSGGVGGAAALALPPMPTPPMVGISVHKRGVCKGSISYEVSKNKITKKTLSCSPRLCYLPSPHSLGQGQCQPVAAAPFTRDNAGDYWTSKEVEHEAPVGKPAGEGEPKKEKRTVWTCGCSYVGDAGSGPTHRITAVDAVKFSRHGCGTSILIAKGSPQDKVARKHAGGAQNPTASEPYPPLVLDYPDPAPGQEDLRDDVTALSPYEGCDGQCPSARRCKRVIDKSGLKQAKDGTYSGTLKVECKCH